ncbi:carbamoyltransferase C-terminal domain-containing protein [Pandoraea vervacti]|uniref:carbamoyltransferase C-terminal domain-containing protein n=1 Tax=Pandoraea vervacti TaxID=656178 RepID=UPI000933C642|nr:carbamoyltransferase C-terminal domain-containing protein [Pandoraea vervacti]
MKILSFKPGHDGCATFIDGGVLQFSYEAEKDSSARFAALDPSSIVNAFQQVASAPDVIAISGWQETGGNLTKSVGGGYFGLEVPPSRTITIFDRETILFSSSHERSHILCAYALSPFPQGTPCYALVWEGYLGRFYYVDAALNIRLLCDIMCAPGIRYAFAYGLIDPTFNLPKAAIRLSDAGKLMALAAFCDHVVPTPEEECLVEKLLSRPKEIPYLSKEDFRDFSQYNCGVTSNIGKRLARLISDAIYTRFESAMHHHIQRRAPLLIAGGCGLNCDWNSSFAETGMFSDVFVPPCANDSGSAIGTAADAQFHLSGSAKIEWSVYSGQPFILDELKHEDFVSFPASPSLVAKHLFDGAILGWADGNAEIGPRALGHRSILASPLEKSTLEKINLLKRREGFRPIAPICREEEVAEHFFPATPSPFMLHFRRVINPRLPAITHVDGSARVQTLSNTQNPNLHEVLGEFRRLSGLGVLCNTSLNFNGNGFINRSSDLARFASQIGLDGFVITNRLYMRKQNITPPQRDLL